MTTVIYTGITGRETVGYSIDGEDLIEHQPRPRATRPARPRPRRRQRTRTP